MANRCRYTVMLLVPTQNWEGVEAENKEAAISQVASELAWYLDFLDGEYALVAIEEDEYEEPI